MQIQCCAVGFEGWWLLFEERRFWRRGFCFDVIGVWRAMFSRCEFNICCGDQELIVASRRLEELLEFLIEVIGV